MEASRRMAEAPWAMLAGWKQSVDLAMRVRLWPLAQLGESRSCFIHGSLTSISGPEPLGIYNPVDLLHCDWVEVYF
jgi:hypothetical protein